MLASNWKKKPLEKLKRIKIKTKGGYEDFSSNKEMLDFSNYSN